MNNSILIRIIVQQVILLNMYESYKHLIMHLFLSHLQAFSIEINNIMVAIYFDESILWPEILNFQQKLKEYLTIL